LLAPATALQRRQFFYRAGGGSPFSAGRVLAAQRHEEQSTESNAVRISTKGITAAGVVLLASATPSLAIEGLQLSVQCPDVVLGWPSTPWENYIVQWRPTLNPSTPWVTLTNSLLADWTTNWTTFVDSNRVQCALGGTNSFSGGGGEPPPVPSLAGRATSTSQVSEPQVRRADGSGSTVPLCIYPPGFDLSGFIILDPSTGEWVSGAGYTLSRASLNQPQPDDPQPQDDGPGGDPPPDPGFYQVVKDGVKISSSSLSNLTSGLLSGTVPISFEAGNAAYDGTGTNLLGTLSCASLLVDGEKYQGGAVLSAGQFPWVFSLDTAYLQNGDHWLQIQVSWKNPDSTDNNHQYLSRWSDAVSITASNQISYPDWEPEVGEMGISAYFLQTTCTNADWSIDIYDSGSNFVKRLSGHTMDGTIEAYWDLVDTNGVTRTNATLDPWFDSVVTVADPVSVRTPRKNQRPQCWPDHGKWVVAYQDFFKFEYSQNNLMQGSIDAFTNTVANYGGYYLYYPQPGQTNDYGQTYPMRYQNTNHMDTNITSNAIYLDAQMLWTFLSYTNSRNFFYDGHGDADNIAGIASSVLNAVITNRYRFVFLDSCNSANGDLDKAFGINGPKRFDIGYYERTGIRPAAFMGYTADVPYNDGQPITRNGVRYDDTIPPDVPYFITNFLFYWNPYDMGYGVLSAIDNGKLYLSPVAGVLRENYLAVHGYYNLHIDEVNHKSDTW
jgi:hypothetical protein